MYRRVERSPLQIWEKPGQERELPAEGQGEEEGSVEKELRAAGERRPAEVTVSGKGSRAAEEER
jgi:hypothetical protein